LSGSDRVLVGDRLAVGVVFGEEPLESDLVDPADGGGLLLVADAPGEGERRRHDVQQAEQEKAADPGVTREVGDRVRHRDHGNAEGQRCLHEERGGGPGRGGFAAVMGPVSVRWRRLA